MDVRAIEDGTALSLGPTRSRRPGAGRKKTTEKDPTLLPDLKVLVESTTRGDPESPLLWTARSQRNIVAALKAHHLPVTYAVFPDEGHGFGRPENNIAFFGIAEAFLSAQLGGMYAPLSQAELEASSMQVKDGKDGIPGL